MYSRDEMKALADKVLNMAKADAVELEFTGGERSGTRWANSTITTNLIQFDQQLTVTVRYGNKTGSASTRELDHDSLTGTVDAAQTQAKAARDSRNLLPLVKGPQDYVAIEAASNVTCNAITTDFWGALDTISGKPSWQMFGTGGDAKGQPTQTNSISHGSPWLRIRKMLVGAAFA